MRRILLSLGLFVLLCAPASAGTLFPPTGAVANASGIPACPANTALVWSAAAGGSLECVNTSQMVSIPSCAAGHVMKGVTNGAPDCVPSSAGSLVTIYQCPLYHACNDGQVISGAWASYGCNGQINVSSSFCQNVWFQGGGHTCENACTLLGKIAVQP